MNEIVPFLPESAPFTPEQRAYLNGFFAGLFSRGTAPSGNPVTASAQLTPLSILFGSQTGTAEGLGRKAVKEAAKQGFAATLHDLAEYPLPQLASEKKLLIITSTYGDGEPPDNARDFWKALQDPAFAKLTEVSFSVCALGDTNYPQFCAFGKQLDARLEALGATRVSPRQDCDLDYEEPFQSWLKGALGAFGAGAPALASGSSLPDGGRRPTQEAAGSPSVAVEYSKSRPFRAPLLRNLKLNAPGSAKDTRHFEFSLEGSGLTYEAGDALGVIPRNCSQLVAELIRALGVPANSYVPIPGGGSASLKEALTASYEITKIPQPLLKAFAQKAPCELLTTLTSPTVNGELTKYLWGRDILDLFREYPLARFAPEEFVGYLKKLQPRLYSISSSPAAHQNQVHLTTAVVRYESLGRVRKGVCSTFLAEGIESGKPVPVFVHRNKAFKLPVDPSTPVIMVGPGTGIAPFRGFLHERIAAGATGKSWLFFGDQKSSTDFLYREELETFLAKGQLSKLCTAFSRDQAEKIYVQDRMLEHATELFEWFEQGACFYVCGDGSRMAKDVHAALQKVARIAGDKSESEAVEYVNQLQRKGRYKRDVY